MDEYPARPSHEEGESCEAHVGLGLVIARLVTMMMEKMMMSVDSCESTMRGVAQEKMKFRYCAPISSYTLSKLLKRAPNSVRLRNDANVSTRLTDACLSANCRL